MRKGYNIKEGQNIYKTGYIHEVTARKGVSKPKKKHEESVKQRV